MWKWYKPLVFLGVAQSPLKVALQLSGLYIVRLVISLIENDSDAMTFICQIALFSAGILLLNIASNIIAEKIRVRQYFIRCNYIHLINHKIMDADYENIEDPDGMNKMQKATQTIYGDKSATQEIINIMIYALTSVLSILSLFAIITLLNPVLLIAMVTLTLIQHSINKAGHRWRYKNEGKWAPLDRKLNHVNYVSGDFARAKDIRLYNLKSWLHDIFSDVLGKRTEWYRKTGRASFCFYDINQAIIQLIVCNGITFAYLIANVHSGSITISEAVFYLSAIGTLAGVIMDVVNSASQLNAASLSICHLREFLDMRDMSNRGAGAGLPDSALEISFQNVSFKYPKAEKNAVDGITFTIKKGEKVAIVGRNGAGKTTLVKLICGLYRPSGGKISINGNEISDYNRDDYFTLISAVFQDIYLFTVSIAQNIALCEEPDINADKLTAVIGLAGLHEKIQRLPGGINTFILKSIIDNAIELSGGEKQKLSLARALYKNGLLLILDEPTAALDPIAEHETYLRYNDFSAGKTSIFISHRLASTRFCDRIFLIDEGKIIEAGSHDELMALNGNYAGMYNVQSYYYRDGCECKEIGEDGEDGEDGEGGKTWTAGTAEKAWKA